MLELIKMYVNSKLQNLNISQKKIIPFFKKYPIVGVKAKDFARPGPSPPLYYPYWAHLFFFFLKKKKNNEPNPNRIIKRGGGRV